MHKILMLRINIYGTGCRVGRLLSVLRKRGRRHGVKSKDEALVVKLDLEVAWFVGRLLCAFDPNQCQCTCSYRTATVRKHSTMHFTFTVYIRYIPH